MTKYINIIYINDFLLIGLDKDVINELKTDL
jgi:hypothetical protein